jgi:ubiquinone/menaquinone biosynthesis C-methylase UbiE
MGDGFGGPEKAAEVKAAVTSMFGRMAPTYDSGLALFDVFGRGLVTSAAVRPGECVLDVACGRGACLLPAAEAVGPKGRVLGVDLSPEMIELIGEQLRRDSVANAEVRVGDAEHLEIEDRSFDVVLCGFCVFLFPQPLQAFGEFRRVLRAGGRFACSTFADGVLDYPWVFDALDEAGIQTGLRPRSEPNPLLTSEGLSKALAQAEFDQITTTPMEHRFLFGDVDALLRWWQSHFLGPAFSRMHADELHRFRRACDRQLQNHRAADGYELVKQVHFTLASRA